MGVVIGTMLGWGIGLMASGFAAELAVGAAVAVGLSAALVSKDDQGRGRLS